MNRHVNPGPPEGQEPIEQLFSEVFGLAEETARQMTDAEVDARLDQLLRKTGHAAAPVPEPDPASVLDTARRQAGKIVADAQRAAAEKTAEAACAARAAEDTARRQAESIIAEAEEYSDVALGQAAAIIGTARGQAESIIAEAKEQAGQIIGDARRQATQADGRARQLAQAGECHFRTQRLLTATYFDPAQSHGWLPGPCDPDSPDTSRDHVSPGWLDRSWKSVRSHWQSLLGRVASGRPDRLPIRSVGCGIDGYHATMMIIIVDACIAHTPEEDTHTADLPGAARIPLPQGDPARGPSRPRRRVPA